MKKQTKHSIDNIIKRPADVKAILTIFMASSLLLLFGVFTLDKWAEASAIHHALQHVVIFLSGCGAGSALLRAYHERKPRP